MEHNAICLVNSAVPCISLDLQKYVILLEEEVIPSTDLLNYFAQLLPVLDIDDTLIGAVAWNENGITILTLQFVIITTMRTHFYVRV